MIEIETWVRERLPAAVPLAEAMVDVMRGIPGPRPVDTQLWYEDACWARAAIEYGNGMTLPDEDYAAVVAARHAYRLVDDEPVLMWGRRVALDAAPVRMVYLLEIAARLRSGDHPVPVRRTESRKLRVAYGNWCNRVRWCEAMFYGLGGCTAYLKEAVAAR